jgi:hypothetical protein
MSTFLPDAFGTFLEINPQFISYRNRVIDVHAISTYQTKSRKVTLNTFKQNMSLPTMCVWFKTVDDAKNAVATMTRILYGVESECPTPEPVAENEPREALSTLTDVPSSSPQDLTALAVVSGFYISLILLFNLLYYFSRSSSAGSGDEL